MLLGDIQNFVCIMTDTDKIRIVMSTGAQFEIKNTDEVYMDEDGILLIPLDGDRVTINIDYIVFVTLIRG